MKMFATFQHAEVLHAAS